MIIPYYWADARLQNKLPSRQVTVKRWGWSDISQEEAQALADRRAYEAMERILKGEDLRRRETLETYGTEDGLPIREEVVSRHENDNVIVTRNSYGSLCLNTPNVFFADVDTQWHGNLKIQFLGCMFILVVGLIAGFWQRSFLTGTVILFGVSWLWSALNNWVNQKRRPIAEARAKEQNLVAIHNFSVSHPDWHLRVYETPAGFRLLAMHDVFDPRGDEAKAALNDLNSDKRFANLCALQACFRARVSPKYWRMGYKPKESLPTSKWPFRAEHLPIRKRWLEGYNAISPKFASCRFIERLGCDRTHAEAEAVRTLHDELCRANSDLPLA